jgi:hypothetical protein
MIPVINFYLRLTLNGGTMRNLEQLYGVDAIEAELQSARERDARVSVHEVLASWPSLPSTQDRKLAERVLAVALDVGIGYSGELVRLAELVYAPREKVVEVVGSVGSARTSSTSSSPFGLMK